MRKLKQPKGEVMQFDDQKTSIMNTSTQKQYDMALYKLNLEKQMMKQEIRLNQRIVKKKLRELKRTRKNIKPCDDLLTKYDFRDLANAVSILPRIGAKPVVHIPEEGLIGGGETSNADIEVMKGRLTLPKIVTEYKKFPDEFVYPLTMRRPSIASTISPLMPTLPSIAFHSPKKKSYQFKDLDDEDFFKFIKRRTQLPEMKQRQKEAQEKVNQMKDKINKFFDPEVDAPPEEEQKVATPVEDKRNAMRGRGFGNARALTEISEKSIEEESEAEEETKPGHKIVNTEEDPGFDLKAEILSNPVFAARKKCDEEETVDSSESLSTLRKKKLLNLAQTIIPHALERVKVIGDSQKKSRQRKRIVKFK